MTAFGLIGMIWCLGVGFITALALVYFGAWLTMRYGSDLVGNIRCVHVLQRIIRRRKRRGLPV